MWTKRITPVLIGAALIELDGGLARAAGPGCRTDDELG